jgi:ribosomal protein S18 acetylase RimI-like enzyme
MDEVLDNPVYNGLCSGDAHLAFGTPTAKYFEEVVSPFAGLDENDKTAFRDLALLLPPGRVIFYATRQTIVPPPGWQLLREVKGLQFVHVGEPAPGPVEGLVSLNDNNAGEMVELATLTKPGPFNLRTHEFGHYFGVFQQDRLVAMAGQRFHPGNYSEISAVCTHPDHLGRGYASLLIQHQLVLIRQQNRIPFLHVRDDNSRAISLYLRLGFIQNGSMNFYILRRS